jgi:hypothetical protein
MSARPRAYREIAAAAFPLLDPEREFHGIMSIFLGTGLVIPPATRATDAAESVSVQGSQVLITRYGGGSGPATVPLGTSVTPLLTTPSACRRRGVRKNPLLPTSSG